MVSIKLFYKTREKLKSFHVKYRTGQYFPILGIILAVWEIVLSCFSLENVASQNTYILVFRPGKYVTVYVKWK